MNAHPLREVAQRIVPAPSALPDHNRDSADRVTVPGSPPLRSGQLMTGKDPGRGFPLVGLAVAACVACCAAPLLGVIGGAGLVAAVGALAAGALAVAVVITGLAVAVLTLSWRRRRRRATGPVQIERPARSTGERSPRTDIDDH